MPPEPADRSSVKSSSHAFVIGTSATFWRHPINNLIGVHDVASLTVDTVGGVNLKPLTVGIVADIENFVDVSRTEFRARIAIYLTASILTNISIRNQEMVRLVFIVSRARVMHVG